MPYFYTGFMWYFTYTIKAPLSLRKHEKKSRGRCPWAPAGALSYAHWISSEKMTSQPTFFFAVCTHPKVSWIDTGFLICLIKHTLWYVFQKWRHVCVSYICWYLLGSMSLTCLPIFSQQSKRKHNDIKKNVTFWMKLHSCLFFMTVWCVFFYQSVFFYQWCFYVVLYRHK